MLWLDTALDTPGKRFGDPPPYRIHPSIQKISMRKFIYGEIVHLSSVRTVSKAALHAAIQKASIINPDFRAVAKSDYVKVFDCFNDTHAILQLRDRDAETLSFSLHAKTFDHRFR